MTKPLFSDDEDSHDVQLAINDHYAKAFEYRKEREELDRLKVKYGSDYDPNTSESGFSTDSESAESEDEHGEELTLTVDAAILRTLARIKDKDPAIYDSSKNIFGEEQKKIASKSLSTKGSSKSRTKSKPVTIRQANLDSILHGPLSPSPEDDPRPPTYVQEQENLRKDTISAFHSAVPEGDGDDFLVARAKAKDEFELEDEEYRTFLEREVGDLKNLVSIDRDGTDKASDDGEQSGHEADEAQMARKKKKKNMAGSGSRVVKEKKSRAEKDQEFLMNYILNRGWIDRSERYIPTYEEVTSTKGQKDKAEAMVNDLNKEEEENGLFSDSSFDSLASHFEASYNHRFEEPGAAAIPTFPRNIQSTVRRQDTTRKEARERRKARKEEELAKKREEVKMLKALKMREVRRKLEVIGRQAGLKGKGKGKIEGQAEDEDDDFVDEALRELDLEGDWNPEKHDQQMAGLFDREDVFEDDVTLEGDGDEDGLTFGADGKPVWEDEIDIGNIAMPDDNVAVEGSQEKRRKKKKKGRKGQGDDDVGVDIDAMDADADVVFEDDDEWDGTEEMQKRVLKRYMDELDNLDFNDMVGDLPTRFKYVPIQSNDYSLTPAEILMATDKELNEYLSVKKYAPYRLSKADNRHRFAKAQQEKLWELKSKVAERKGTGFGQEPDGGLKVKKRKGKKERMRMKSELDAAMATTAVAVAVADDFPSSSTKRKRGDENETGSFVADDGSDKESAPKKTKRKRKHKKEGESGSNAVEA